MDQNGTLSFVAHSSRTDTSAVVCLTSLSRVFERLGNYNAFSCYFLKGTVLGFYDSNLAKVQLYANKKRYKIKIHMIMKMIEEESLSVSFLVDLKK